MGDICSSCKTDVSNNTGTSRFMCPKCGKEQLIRCSRCRRSAVKYTCSGCNFEGPN